MLRDELSFRFGPLSQPASAGSQITIWDQTMARSHLPYLCFLSLPFCSNFS